jgi:hypothetical protein
MGCPFFQGQFFFVFLVLRYFYSGIFWRCHSCKTCTYAIFCKHLAYFVARPIRANGSSNFRWLFTRLYLNAKCPFINLWHTSTSSERLLGAGHHHMNLLFKIQFPFVFNLPIGTYFDWFCEENHFFGLQLG